MSRRHRTAVANAADPKQVQAAGREAKERETTHLSDLRALLAMPEGQRVLWHYLDRFRAFRSVFDENAHRMAYQSGRQDAAHELMSDIDRAQPDAFLTLMRTHAPENHA